MSTPFINRSARILGLVVGAIGLLALGLAGSASADEGHVHADPAAAVAPVAAPAEVVEQPAPGVPAPVDHAAHARPTPAPVTAPAVVSPTSGGGAANSAPTATAAPRGELPFTGTGDNILLIALAGMLVPMGVLLYSAARRGDLRLRLAMPRFQWATPVPHEVADARAFQWVDR